MTPKSLTRMRADGRRRVRVGRPRRPVTAGGFTLMELLVTLAVLLAIFVVVLPNVTGVKMQANENAAMSSLKAIYHAQVAYAAKYPVEGFSCSLEALGGPAHGAGPTPAQALLLPQELAAGRKSGYVFSITDCAHGKSSQPEQVTGFRLTAVPIALGHTGHFGYCLNQTDALRMDPTGGTECTQDVE